MNTHGKGIHWYDILFYCWAESQVNVNNTICDGLNKNEAHGIGYHGGISFFYI